MRRAYPAMGGAPRRAGRDSLSFRTGITSVVPWLVVSREQQSHSPQSGRRLVAASVEPCSPTQALRRRKKDRRPQLVDYSVVDRLLVRGVRSVRNEREWTMRISKQLDAEFKYMRGSGTRRHREMCAANAQSPNVPTATGHEPRC